jgi:hypothetical protein
MKPSNFIKGMIAHLIDQNREDALKLCLDIEKQLVRGIAEELLYNEMLSFEDRFQLIADLQYCSDLMEKLLDHLQRSLVDPFYLVMGMLDEE